ncbi:MAG: hypothetical protein MJH11_03380 [Lentisphaeria bacterium]|nr:hypothetical protein [Lentisphaeria bacterium]
MRLIIYLTVLACILSSCSSKAEKAMVLIESDYKKVTDAIANGDLYLIYEKCNALFSRIDLLTSLKSKEHDAEAIKREKIAGASKALDVQWSRIFIPIFDRSKLGMSDLVLEKIASPEQMKKWERFQKINKEHIAEANAEAMRTDDEKRDRTRLANAKKILLLVDDPNYMIPEKMIIKKEVYKYLAALFAPIQIVIKEESLLQSSYYAKIRITVVGNVVIYGNETASAGQHRFGENLIYAISPDQKLHGDWIKGLAVSATEKSKKWLRTQAKPIYNIREITRFNLVNQSSLLEKINLDLKKLADTEVDVASIQKKMSELKVNNTRPVIFLKMHEDSPGTLIKSRLFASVQNALHNDYELLPAGSDTDKDIAGEMIISIIGSKETRSNIQRSSGLFIERSSVIYTRLESKVQIRMFDKTNDLQGHFRFVANESKDFQPTLSDTETSNFSSYRKLAIKLCNKMSVRKEWVSEIQKKIDKATSQD